MSKIIFIAIIICISFQITEAQWISQYPNTPGVYLYDVEFINRNTGWSCGDGVILKTTNGGTNWKIQSQPATNKPLLGIHPVDSNIIYCVGYFETILKSTNGGYNWTAITNGPNGQGHSYYAVYFTNKDTGWVSRSLQAVLKTTNGGLSFDTVFCPYGGVDDFYFHNQQEGLGCKGMVKTTDGGNSWYSIYIPVQEVAQIKRMSFINYNTGYCVTYSGKVLKTTNFGNNWDSISYISDLGFEFIYCSVFKNDSIGYAGGEFGKIFKTTDGGKNWLRLNNGSDQRFWSSLWFYDNNTGWGVGGNTRISFTESGGITNVNNFSENMQENFILNQNFPNPFNNSTTIEFVLKKDGHYKIEIYNVLGKKVDVILDEYKAIGSYKVNYNAKNLSSGVYLYVLSDSENFSNFSLRKKLILIK